MVRVGGVEDRREYKPHSCGGTVLAVLTEPHARDLGVLLRQLRDLTQARSIVQRLPGEPDFILASGAHSRYYCDTKRVTLSPEGSQLTGEILFTLCQGGADVEAIGGLILGATFIATAVALVSAQHGRPIYGYTVRDEQKKHGTGERVAQSFHPDGRELLCPGRRVAVVDDVVTKGGSILKAISAVQERQCEITRVIALVDRNQGGGEELLRRGLPYFALFNADTAGNLTINDDLSRPQQPLAGLGGSAGPGGGPQATSDWTSTDRAATSPLNQR